MKAPHIDALVEIMAARMHRIEHGYLERECGYLMTDAQLATLRTALRLPKDKSYRPYCLANGCADMPRMALQPLGFDCPCCGNGIGFDLKLRTSQPSQTTVNNSQPL